MPEIPKILHRFTTQRGINLIKRFEGFSAVVYKCIAGFDTVGWGHVVRQGEVFASPITEEQGEELLKKDLFLSERAVLRLISVPLTDGEFDSLVSFTFNLGSGTLQRSTLRQKLNRNEDRLEVANEFLKWIFAGGKKSKGLLRRRMAERELFLT